MLINDLTELGELIRRRRVEQRLSQTELAEKVGTTRQWVSRLEKGKNDIGTARLLAVLDVLELNLDIRAPRSGSSSDAFAVETTSLIPPATLRALADHSDRVRSHTLSLLPRGEYLHNLSAGLTELAAAFTPRDGEPDDDAP